MTKKEQEVAIEIARVIERLEPFRQAVENGNFPNLESLDQLIVETKKLHERAVVLRYLHVNYPQLVAQFMAEQETAEAEASPAEATESNLAPEPIATEEETPEEVEPVSEPEAVSTEEISEPVIETSPEVDPVAEVQEEIASEEEPEEEVEENVVESEPEEEITAEAPTPEVEEPSTPDTIDPLPEIPTAPLSPEEIAAIDNSQPEPFDMGDFDREIQDMGIEGSGESLNEKISRFGSEKSLADKLQSQPIESLTKAIGLNERFLYTNELFDGDVAAFNRALNELNHLNDLDEARRFVHHQFVSKYSWQSKKPTADSFMDLVERRYLP